MGIKDFFRPTPAKGAASANGSVEIDELSQRIFQSCSDSVDSIISNHEDIPDDYHLRITLMFTYGLLHLADRVAFGILGNQRAEVMDRLVIGTATHAIQELSGPAITPAQKKQLVGDLVEKINAASATFGQFKKLTPENDGSAQGTLMWEFGKQFADATGHAMDVAYIYEGSATLIALFEGLGVNEAFNTLAKG